MNPSLFKVCKEDAINICSAQSNWHETGIDVNVGPLVLPCLFHHIDDENKKVFLFFIQIETISIYFSCFPPSLPLSLS